MRNRIIFGKQGGLRFTSTLDLQKIWERTFRRAKIDMAYTQGFHPHPKIQVALPLPMGFTSQVEIVDVWIYPELPIQEIEAKLSEKLPVGMEILSIHEVQNNKDSLINKIISASYKVEFELSQSKKEDLLLQIDQFLVKKSIPRIRRKKKYDLRPLVNSLGVEHVDSTEFYILMNLSAKPGKTGRPDEVVDELGLDITDCLITRTSIETSEAIGDK
jgi:radical SAM-linked protein